MINPKELRIDNYVQDSEGVLGTISSISRYTVDVVYFDEYAKIYLDNDPDLHPIPLTDEWLVKFGFEKHHADFYNDLILIKASGHFKIYPSTLGEAICPMGQPIVKYVHQLQNLYFALTGEELTVKEEV